MGGRDATQRGGEFRCRVDGRIMTMTSSFMSSVGTSEGLIAIIMVISLMPVSGFRQRLSRLRRGRDDSQPVLHRTQPEDYCRHSSRPRECLQENAPRRSFGADAKFKNMPAYLPTKLWTKMDINAEW